MDPSAQHLLDSVPWATLHHAYGPATDVPANLLALLSPTKSDRDAASDALYSNIFHQTTRYEATAHAVPYLLHIIQNKSTPARANIISYLVDLALGMPSTYLPQGVDIREWRQKTERLYAPGYEAEYYREQDELIAQARNENQRKMLEYVRGVGLERKRKDARWELAAYDAVALGVPVFRKLLREEEEEVEVRAFAAYALAWFPGEDGNGERDRGSADVLEGVLERGSEDNMVLASSILALGLLNGCWKDGGAVPEGMDGLVARLRGFGERTRPAIVRFAAAVALVRLQHHRAEDVAVLGTVVADRSFIPAADAKKSEDLGFPFHEGGLFQYAGKVLSTLDMGDFPDVMFTIFDPFPRLGRVQAAELAEVVLEMVFGPRPEDEDERPVESLSAIQRQTITVLAELPRKSWQGGLFGDTIQEWNIPGGSRDECREYIGLPAGGSDEEDDEDDE